MIWQLSKSTVQTVFKYSFIIAYILSRGILAFKAPILEDDYYRYLWDGQVFLSGINPYQFAPLDERLDLIVSAWRSLINYPDIRTIYPPVAQFYFAGIFATFGESVFGDFFGGGGRRQQQQRHRGVRGSNIRIKVKLTLKEIAEGTRKTIKVKKYVVCDTCHGSGAKDASSVSTCKTCQGSGYVRKVQNTILGQMATTQTCHTCHGSGQQVTANCTKCHGAGRMYAEDTINIDIPAGVHDGIELSMNGKGNAGEKGGPNGDLLISIEEIKDAELKREGNHVLYNLYISFVDAALGTKVEIPTIDGKVRITIPEGRNARRSYHAIKRKRITRT